MAAEKRPMSFWDKYGPPLAAVLAAAAIAHAERENGRIHDQLREQGKQMEEARIATAEVRIELAAVNKSLERILARAQERP